MRKLRRWLNSRNMMSVEDVVGKLDRKGISRDEITGKHLAPVYARLNRIPSAPDFGSVDELLSRGASPVTNIDCSVIGVIVETRRHPALEYVVENFIRNLEIPIQLFHGNANRDFIMSGGIAEFVNRGKVHLTQLETDNLDARKYNALFLSEGFWAGILSKRKVLVFQTDTIICEKSDYSLDDFLAFDYVGSKWPRRRPVGLLLDGGNGGLSLRDWGRSCECLRRFPPVDWFGGEDGYFAFHIDLIGGKVGRGDDCARFSTQHEFVCKSFGAHQISSLSSESRKAFLKYCEEARFMVGNERRAYRQ